MFPPVDSSTLRANPQFEQLYTQLTTSLLNPDGSTKSKAAQKSQDAARENLKAAQEQAARSQFLRKSLAQLTSRENDLPDELREVIDIVTAQLNGRLSSEDREMLEDDVDYFLDHLRPIANTLSTHLTSSALQLTRIAYPEESNPRTLQTLIPTLPTHTTTLRQTLTHAQDTLSTAHQTLTTTATLILTTHTTCLETLIRILEQTKHGSVSREIRAHADHLAVAAESMDAKLKLMKHEALAAIYTPDVQSALQNYGEHLRDTKMRLQQRERAAREEVERYTSKGAEMRMLVVRYSGLLRELEGVRADVRRLGLRI